MILPMIPMVSLMKHRNGMTLIQIANMNERILELMKQADYPAPELALRAHKLAELIVRECMRMCDCADVSYLEHGCDKEASGAAGAKQFIKEWFEVEE
jgi:hypothetical protein